MFEVPGDIVPWHRRRYDVVRPTSAREVVIDGQRLVQVCSTQYLGMPWDDRFQSAVSQAVTDVGAQGWGSFGSHYLGGTHELRLQFEGNVALLCGCDAALAFPTGWAACYAAAEVASRLCDVIVVDSHCHNSIWSGLSRSRARIVKADFTAAEVTADLVGPDVVRVGVISSSLEGLSGLAITPIIQRHVREKCVFILDEMHSFGAVGVRGVEPFEQLVPDVRILGLSKALGTIGAVVCGTEAVVSLFSQLASPWIFSTAVPPVLWSVNDRVLQLSVSMAPERDRIHTHADEFRALLQQTQIGFYGRHHITGIRVPPSADTSAVEDTLRHQGFFAKVSQYPSRPQGDPCIRIAFNPFHQRTDVARLASALEGVLRGGQ